MKWKFIYLKESTVVQLKAPIHEVCGGPQYSAYLIDVDSERLYRDPNIRFLCVWFGKVGSVSHHL